MRVRRRDRWRDMCSGLMETRMVYRVMKFRRRSDPYLLVELCMLGSHRVRISVEADRLNLLPCKIDDV